MKLTKPAITLFLLSLTAFGQAQTTPASPLRLCLYFDLGSLSPSDLATAQQAAVRFVQEQMKPSDQISVMTYTSQLNVLQDFTGDRDELLAVLRMIMRGDAAVVAPRLLDLQAAAGILGNLPEKKAMFYFSGAGLGRNERDGDELTATVNALMRANISVFPIDARSVVSRVQ